MKTYGFVLFLLFFSLAYVLMHYYSAWFVQRNFIAFRNVKYIFLLMAFLSVLSLVLRRNLTGNFVYYLSLAGYVWMGCVFIFSSCSLLCDLLMLAGPAVRMKILPPVFLLVSLGVSAKALYNGFKIPVFKTIEVFSDKIEKDVKIALLSDLHLDYRFKKDIFLKILGKTAAEKPDLILFCGDLLDPGFEMSAEEFASIKNIEIPMIGVMGNHEYYYDPEKAEEVYKKMGIKLLINKSLKAGQLNIIGLGDMRTENITADGALAIVKSLEDKKTFNIILSHQPLYFRRFSVAGDFLMLSGHVHKAQIFPFHALVRPFYKYFYGLYHENNSDLYVTSGSGTWGPPMRLLAEAEIPVIIVRKTAGKP